MSNHTPVPASNRLRAALLDTAAQVLRDSGYRDCQSEEAASIVLDVVWDRPLIAAAPALLEACKGVVACCPTVGRDDSPSGNAWRYAAEAIQQAKAAIALAEGSAA